MGNFLFSGNFLGDYHINKELGSVLKKSPEKIGTSGNTWLIRVKIFNLPVIKEFALKYKYKLTNLPRDTINGTSDYIMEKITGNSLSLYLYVLGLFIIILLIALVIFFLF